MHKNINNPLREIIHNTTFGCSLVRPYPTEIFMRLGFVRSIHTTRAALAFRQASGSGSKKDTPSTPRKNSGEFRWYEDAAPYSNFQKRAPQVSEADVEITEMQPEKISELKSAQLISWPKSVSASLHHLGSFKPNQQNELFSSNVTVVRNESERIFSSLLKSGKSSLLVGDAGVGKSTLLAQAHAAARAQNWAVIHISQAEKLLDGSSSAILNQSTGKWEQPMIVQRLHKKALGANREASEADAKGQSNSLASKQASESSPTTLKGLLDLYKGQKVLLTADNVNALNHLVFSQNTDLENNKLYHNDLEVVSTFLDLLSKPTGDVCVMGATSGNYKPIDFEGYAYAPLNEFDPALTSKLAKAERLDVGRFNGSETQSYVDYLKAAKVTDKNWEELYQFGNGNPRSILSAATNFAY